MNGRKEPGPEARLSKQQSHLTGSRETGRRTRPEAEECLSGVRKRGKGCILPLRDRHKRGIGA